MEANPIIVGIAGGTGAGKTVLSHAIADHVNSTSVVIIQHDSYYKDRRHLAACEREQLNYDHPDALDTELLVNHLKGLIAGNTIEMPIYDFFTHCRSDKRTQVMPARVIIVEGILLFANAELRKLLDIKIFVDADNDIRFIRRIQRDTMERNRSIDSVVKQYVETTRAMYIDFVEPSKKHADIVVIDVLNSKSVDAILSMIDGKLSGISH